MAIDRSQQNWPETPELPEAIAEHYEHAHCPKCDVFSVPAENVPDQQLRGCPFCGYTWFEQLWESA